MKKCKTNEIVVITIIESFDIFATLEILEIFMNYVKKFLIVSTGMIIGFFKIMSAYLLTQEQYKKIARGE